MVKIIIDTKEREKFILNALYNSPNCIFHGAYQCHKFNSCKDCIRARVKFKVEEDNR